MGTAHQKVTEMIVVSADKISGSKNVEKVVLFNEDGSPFGLAGDSSGSAAYDNSGNEAAIAALEARVSALEAK